jgi:hypothetical protein
MEAKHYYESHITIEPVFDDHDLKFIRAFAATHSFKLADLLMRKRDADTEERSSKDTFMTGHSKDLGDIKQRTRAIVKGLQSSGFKVWRYKIEDIVLDSRIEDEFGLLT